MKLIQAFFRAFDAICTLVAFLALAAFFFYLASVASENLGWGLGGMYATMFFGPILILMVIARYCLPGVVLLPFFGSLLWFLSFNPAGPVVHSRTTTEVANYMNQNYVMSSVLTGADINTPHYKSDLVYGMRRSYNESWEKWYNFAIGSGHTRNGFEEQWGYDAFDKAWGEFFDWFITHDWPKDGNPPVPYYFDQDRMDHCERHPQLYRSLEDIFAACAKKDNRIPRTPTDAEMAEYESKIVKVTMTQSEYEAKQAKEAEDARLWEEKLKACKNDKERFELMLRARAEDARKDDGKIIEITVVPDTDRK